MGRRSKFFRTFWIGNCSSLLVRILFSNFLGRNSFDLSGFKSFLNFLGRRTLEFFRPEFFRSWLIFFQIFWFRNFLTFRFVNSPNFSDPKFSKLPGTKISFSISFHFAKIFGQGNKNNFQKRNLRLWKLENFSNQKIRGNEKEFETK